MAKVGDMECLGLDRPEFDITDRQAVRKALEKRGISVVINASAYTAVDNAESKRDEAFAVNAEGPGYLASACTQQDIPLIHISTDYVFDGLKGSPYVETDPICPTSAYGESKAAGENAVRDHLEAHVILRTSWLYSTHGNNFVKTILRMASEREELRVVADQYGCPTYAADLAAATLHIAEQIQRGRAIPWGTYHYCGKGVTTWHGFATKICEIGVRHVLLKVKEIKPISTREYPTPAKRPPYSAMNCSKIENLFGVQRKLWQDSLAEMLVRIFPQ
jgi:dTDP-4-dehydrorhamnose reductase